MVGALSTKLQDLMERKVVKLSSYVTGIMHSARISTVKFIVSSDNRIKMVN